MISAIRFSNELNQTVTQAFHDGKKRLDSGIDHVSGLIAGGAVKVRDSTFWLGREIKHYVIDPVVAASVQCAKFTWAYKKGMTANLLAWALIIVFCGAIEGYKAVALPMFIGSLPGFAVGAIGGMLSAKAFARDPNGNGFLAQVVQEYRKIPEWPKSVFLALFASLCIVGCTTVPHGMGAILGTAAGGFYGYYATCFNPDNPKEGDRPDHITLLYKEIKALRDQLQAAEERIKVVETPAENQPDLRQLLQEQRTLVQRLNTLESRFNSAAAAMAEPPPPPHEKQD